MDGKVNVCTHTMIVLIEGYSILKDLAGGEVLPLPPLPPTPAVPPAPVAARSPPPPRVRSPGPGGGRGGQWGRGRGGRWRRNVNKNKLIKDLIRYAVNLYYINIVLFLYSYLLTDLKLQCNY